MSVRGRPSPCWSPPCRPSPTHHPVDPHQSGPSVSRDLARDPRVHPDSADRRGSTSGQRSVLSGTFSAWHVVRRCVLDTCPYAEAGPIRCGQPAQPPPQAPCRQWPDDPSRRRTDQAARSIRRRERREAAAHPVRTTSARYQPARAPEPSSLPPSRALGDRHAADDRRDRRQAVPRRDGCARPPVQGQASPRRPRSA
jgi:hypothetical protein